MHSRYDAATLPAPADRSRLGSGWLSGLALSLALQSRPSAGRGSGLSLGRLGKRRPPDGG